MTAKLGKVEIYNKGRPSIKSFDTLNTWSSDHVTDKNFQRPLHVQFSCWPWPWYIFQKLAGHIGARPGLGIQLCFEAPGDVQVDIVKMQWLTLGSWGCPLENEAKLVDSQLAVQKLNKGLHLKNKVCKLCVRGWEFHSKPVFSFNP